MQLGSVGTLVQSVVGPEAERSSAVFVRSVVVWSCQRDFALLSLQEAASTCGGFGFLCSLFMQFSL